MLKQIDGQYTYKRVMAIHLLCIHQFHLDINQPFHCIGKVHSYQSMRRESIHTHSVHSCYHYMEMDTDIILEGQILEKSAQAGNLMFVLSSYTSDNQLERKQRIHHHTLNISFHQHQSTVVKISTSANAD